MCIRTILGYADARSDDERQRLCCVCPRSVGPRIFRRRAILYSRRQVASQPRRFSCVRAVGCKRASRGNSADSFGGFLRRLSCISCGSRISNRRCSKRVFGLCTELPRIRRRFTAMAHRIFFEVRPTTIVSPMDTIFHATPNYVRSNLEGRRTPNALLRPKFVLWSFEGRSSLLFRNRRGTGVRDTRFSGIIPRLPSSFSY
mmetsp:Transcript_15730/g.32309  ORF Transcript_15730/g.32309 Transcript_15730/m.32309 type:complete len:201 (+) Transcript_15730:369-971(+)